MTVKDIQPRTQRAHELYGDFWFNSEPVPVAALRGQVILIEFWDYTCINCLRTLPYLKEWHRKYQPFGLVVVGVHTPKFPFGRDPEEVRKAIQRFGIEYPVVMDNDGTIAARYENRFWPAMILVDRDGFIRFQNVGEGNYGVTEHMIQSLLYDAGVDEQLPEPMEPLRNEDKPAAVCYKVSPELFAGYLRGSIGNVEGYSPESEVRYIDPELYLEGRFYASGVWMNEKNSLRLSEGEGSIILTYHAVEVNAVVKPEKEKGFEVTVVQDGFPLTGENKGADILIAADGRSYFVVDGPRMYNLVRNREYGEHTLRLDVSSTSFGLYSLTFVSCAIPEMMPDS